MYISRIWRYPVKSMGGEEMKHATIGPLGIVGDRVVHVEDAHGRFITARNHPRLLGHRASLDSWDEPTVHGLRWTDPHVLQIAEGIVGTGARLVRDDSAGRFDVLPLLIGTDGAIAAFGHDGRRLRPNIIIGGVDGMAERSWPHHCLNIGNVRIGVADLRTRWARVGSLLLNFLVPLHVMAEVGGLAISIKETAISGDAANEIHSAWTLNIVGVSGKTFTLNWRTLRKWNGSRVVYEHHYDQQRSGEPLTFDDLGFDIIGPVAGIQGRQG